MCLASDNGIIISLGDLSQIALYILISLFIISILLVYSEISKHGI